ncbi:MAG TPA: PEP/pyruvate-binding domain-containing protein, partial [Polyangiaceae bacterium]
MTAIVALDGVLDEGRYGGKAAQLSTAARAGLPVPHGVALDWAALEAFAAGQIDPISAIASMLDLSNGVAVRSSAVGEDSEHASFAGLYTTVLNVRSERGLAEALRAVQASARTDAALVYRRKLGIRSEPRLAAVIQVLVSASVGGVLFTRDPVTGEDVRLVEATWGSPKIVADGTIIPDSYRIARGGRILDRRPGTKDTAIRCNGDREGVRCQQVGAEESAALCLADDDLLNLENLASRCEVTFPGTQDLEFAFDGHVLFLLQRRA